MTMLTPFVWVYQGPLALIWVLGIGSWLFPLLRQLGVWKPDEIDYTVDMRGKIVIVTGSNTGIGKRTAMNIAKMGAEVILACRDLSKAEEARQDMLNGLQRIQQSSSSSSSYPYASNANIVCMQVDLGSLSSVKQFCCEYKKRYKKLNCLVCNAGLANVVGKTEDGFEMMMGVNYLSHFYIIQLLLDSLLAAKAEGARIVNVSSLMHELGCLDFVGSLRGRYRSLKDRLISGHYPDSKFAMILNTLELRERLKGTNVQALAVSPGAVDSDIWRSFGYCYRRFFLDPVRTLLFLNNDQGSSTSVYAATQPLPTGNDKNPYFYYQPYWSCFDWLLPFEVMGPYNGYQANTPRLPREAQKVARQLWELSERCVTQGTKALDEYDDDKKRA